VDARSRERRRRRRLAKRVALAPEKERRRDHALRRKAEEKAEETAARLAEIGQAYLSARYVESRDPQELHLEATRLAALRGTTAVSLREKRHRELEAQRRGVRWEGEEEALRYLLRRWVERRQGPIPQRRQDGRGRPLSDPCRAEEQLRAEINSLAMGLLERTPSTTRKRNLLTPDAASTGAPFLELVAGLSRLLANALPGRYAAEVRAFGREGAVGAWLERSGWPAFRRAFADEP
jgi:hypothetical protein